MKKILLLFFCLIIIGGCSTNDKDLNESPKDESILEIPTVKGSNAYDVIISLDESGIKKPETVINDYGYSWTVSSDYYSYYIESNKNHEIAYAKFTSIITDDKRYLEHCATLPYETSSSEEAKQWVKENVGTNTDATFGDAIYILESSEYVNRLIIKSYGYDEWLNNYLDYLLEDK